MKLALFERHFHIHRDPIHWGISFSRSEKEREGVQERKEKEGDRERKKECSRQQVSGRAQRSWSHS